MVTVNPRAFLVLCLFLAASALPAQEPAPSWKRAQPNVPIVLPDDEVAHPDYKTEWWYFTGNLWDDASDRRFGYQLTFFRIGVRPPAERGSSTSSFVVNDFWFAHLAISDPSRNRFLYGDQFSRGAFEEAGSQLDEPGTRMVWLKDWKLQRTAAEAGHYRLVARSENSKSDARNPKAFGLDLALSPAKPRVLQGENGFSPKSGDPTNASHYYSFTRLDTGGTITIDGQEVSVSGQSWYDREWSTSLLGEGQVGWDWFSIQLNDGSELMLFQLRNREGAKDFASGTYVSPDGSSRQLFADDIQLTPLKTWKSDSSGAEYPTQWRAQVPSLQLDLQVKGAQSDQELNLAPLAYWEGAIDIEGTLASQAIEGVGYLEMTGYATSMEIGTRGQ